MYKCGHQRFCPVFFTPNFFSLTINIEIIEALVFVSKNICSEKHKKIITHITFTLLPCTTRQQAYVAYFIVTTRHITFLICLLEHSHSMF